MTGRDLLLAAPEITLVVVGFLVILLDLAVRRKGWLVGLSVIGVAVAAVFSGLLLAPENQGTAFAGSLVVDNFAVAFKFLFLGIALLLLLASVDYVARFGAHQGEYYALILFSTASMMLMASTRELIAIYIALETTGICLYVLVAMLRDARSSEAALKYLVLGAISSAVLLYGLAMMYGLSGRTDLAAIAQVLSRATMLAEPALLVGLVFVIAGLGFKLATVPFQMWVPDVYEGAATPVTAYLSVASKAAGFALLLRLFYEAFASSSADWAGLFVVISLASMTLGNVVAIVQTNIKRMLAYSSIAQAGYLAVGLASVNELGPSGVVFFLVSYALTNLAAFIAIIAITNRVGSDEINAFAGMGRRAPLLAAVLAFAMLSLTGVPPTGGFIAKIFIFRAGIDAGLLWLVVAAVINSVISAYYYLRVVKVMYLREAEGTDPVPASPALRLALLAAGLGTLYLGVLPEAVRGAAQAAARSLFG